MQTHRQNTDQDKIIYFIIKIYCLTYLYEHPYNALHHFNNVWDTLYLGSLEERIVVVPSIVYLCTLPLMV